LLKAKRVYYITNSEINFSFAGKRNDLVECNARIKKGVQEITRIHLKVLQLNKRVQIESKLRAN